MKKPIMIVGFALTAVAVNAATVTDVTAKQRWPWNNLVDVDFKIEAPVGECYRIELEAKCDGGTRTFVASTYLSNPCVSAGDHRITWDFGADYPDVRAEDMQVSVAAIPFSNATPIYLVIDLSAGPDATHYPHRYSLTPPAHVQGASNEVCQTTELWLRHVAAPREAVQMCQFDATSTQAFYARQTKDYYIGVFELTQKQYALVTGKWPAYFANESCRDARPLENVAYSTLVGSDYNPQLRTDKISSSSFLGKIRTRTGLALTFPSVVQFDWACRGARAIRSNQWWYDLADGTYPVANDIMRTSNNSNKSSATSESDLTAGTSAVGTYAPNALGLYDMLGNVYEFTCETVSSYNYVIEKYLEDYRTAADDQTLGTQANPLVDPRGYSSDAHHAYHIVEQVRWEQSSTSMWWWYGWSSYSTTPKTYEGCRLSMTVE